MFFLLSESQRFCTYFPTFFPGRESDGFAFKLLRTELALRDHVIDVRQEIMSTLFELSGRKALIAV